MCYNFDSQWGKSLSKYKANRKENFKARKKVRLLQSNDGEVKEMDFIVFEDELLRVDLIKRVTKVEDLADTFTSIEQMGFTIYYDDYEINKIYSKEDEAEAAQSNLLVLIVKKTKKETGNFE